MLAEPGYHRNEKKGNGHLCDGDMWQHYTEIVRT